MDRRKFLFAGLPVAMVSVAAGCSNENGGGSRDAGKSKSAFSADDLNKITVDVKGETLRPSDLGVKLSDKDDSPTTVKLKDGFVTVSVDKDVYSRRLSEILKRKGSPEPVDAEVKFLDNEFQVSKKSKPGEVAESSENFLKRLSGALKKNEKRVSLKVGETQPDVTDEDAQRFADVHNTAIQKSHFTVKDERVLGLSPDDYASFFTIEKRDGKLTAVPNEKRILEFSRNLPKELDREVKGGRVIVDDEGKILKKIDPVQDGRKIGDPKKISEMISKAVENGDFAALEIPAVVTPAPLTKLFRRIEVNKSSHRAKLFENEKVVHDFPVAIGTGKNPSDSGDFKVQSQFKKHNMGCTPKYDYCTKDVQWISFYNGGEGFHAAPWHDNFGNSDSNVSHGCINMRTADAKVVYEFAQIGTPVKVYG